LSNFAWLLQIYLSRFSFDHGCCNSYSTIAWIIPVALNHQHNDMTNGNGLVSVTPRYHLPYYDGTTRGGKFHHTDTEAYVLSIFNALSTVAFAYAGHNVSLEIQATLPSTPEEPSRIAMWRGVKLAYAIIALCYFPVALICYWAYGNDLKKSNLGILRYESWPVWLATAANVMVVIHVIGSYLVRLQALSSLDLSLSRSLYFSLAFFPPIPTLLNPTCCALPFPSSLNPRFYPRCCTSFVWVFSFPASLNLNP
jgi:hypothetical protein